MSGLLRFFMMMKQISLLSSGHPRFLSVLKKDRKRKITITGCIIQQQRISKNFTDTKLFLDPGFSVIDCVIDRVIDRVID